MASSLPGLDLEAVEEFLADHRAGPLRAELISGGRSNLTYSLTDGQSHWVLRRPPLGHVLATAHDMGREYRVMAALAPTDVPVPRMVALAGDDVMGAPFYVMEFVDGTIVRTQAQLQGYAADANGLAAELVAVLARLHAVDAAAVGLGELGRPAGYLERQLKRWRGQLEASHSRDQTALLDLHARLSKRLPVTQRESIVHGDYRLDNVVMGADGHIVAVLDWEMATLGDPLADLASTLVGWDGLCGLNSPIAAVPGEVPGFPSRDLLCASYAAATGWDLSELPWYLGFAFWRMAAICEGIHYRAAAGLTVGEGFDRIGELIAPLVARGEAALREF
ncbi:MAG: phosphotransferase family protein [Sporichthyaceae bacterium]